MNIVRPPSITHLDPIVSCPDIRQSSGTHGRRGRGREGRRALRLLVEWLIITILEVGWGNDSVGPQGRMIMAGPLGSGVSIILLDGGEEAKRWTWSQHKRLKGKTRTVTEKCKALFHVSLSKLFFAVGVIRITWAWGFRSDCGAVSEYLTSKFHYQTCSFSVHWNCNLNVLPDRSQKYKALSTELVSSAYSTSSMLSTYTFGLVDMWMVNTHVLIANITVHGENDSRLLRPIFRFFVRRRPLVAVVIIAMQGRKWGAVVWRVKSLYRGSGMDGRVKTSQIIYFPL